MLCKLDFNVDRILLKIQNFKFRTVLQSFLYCQELATESRCKCFGNGQTDLNVLNGINTSKRKKLILP